VTPPADSTPVPASGGEAGTPAPARVCVFCGSHAGADPRYAEAASALGALLARRGHALVYGGARAGLMGAVADAALDGGGRVTGVIPEALWEREIGHTGVTELLVVGSMHERKALMAERSDAFVALPGGVGTLEEFFEAWTWAQLGIHRKPVALLNVAGFYDPLLAMLDHMAREGFVRPQQRAMVLVADAPAALLDRLAAYHAPSTTRWMTAAEA
jgi:uncharacterized protein (TIGR00730 family)